MADSYSVIAFSGHMIDAPNRPMPRFPASRVDYVSARIEAQLAKREGQLQCVSSLADGSDILFVESVLARGGVVTILLPFPALHFKETSVKLDWRERFDTLLASPRVDLRPPLYSQLPLNDAEQNQAFAKVNDAIIETADSLAKRLHDPDPWFLAVYQRSNQNLQGGTGDAFKGWTAKGHRLVIVDPSGE